MTTRVTIAFVSILAIAGCGGGGGNVIGSPNPTTPVTSILRLTPLDTNSNEYRIHAGLTPDDAKRSPVYYTGNLTRVGVDQGAGVQRLPRTAVPGLPNVTVQYGRINDGAGSANLKNYLSATGIPESLRLGGYVVRVIGPSTATERRRVLAAVQLVNAALPEDAKLSVGTPLPGFSLRDTLNSDATTYFGFDRQLPDTIHVEFEPGINVGGRTNILGTSWGEYILLARDAPISERKSIIVMAHEFMHSLGIDGHVFENPDTIMGRIYDIRRNQPASLLYPIDREALRAIYGPLRHSSDPQDLGRWSGTSEHFFVKNEHGAFGVANRNGYAEPWAYGITPETSLSSNRQLSGSASWTGALVGFTPSSDRVVGAAGISVNLGSMNGSAAFTGLSTIETDGTTPQWRDGELRYTIAVRGNTFRETGGDAGRLTGAFAGRSHESVGGTLERSDLSAAFGASR